MSTPFHLPPLPLTPYFDTPTPRRNQPKFTTGGWFSSHGTFTAMLARCSPYVTVRYDGATPFLQSDAAIVNWEVVPLGGDEQGQEQAMTAYAVDYNNGQRWLVFLEGGSVELKPHSNGLAATAPFTGVLRAALVPPAVAAEAEDDAVEFDTSKAEEILIAHAATYPVAATVDWEFEKEKADEAEYTFEWSVEAFGQNELDEVSLGQGQGQDWVGVRI